MGAEKITLFACISTASEAFVNPPLYLVLCNAIMRSKEKLVYYAQQLSFIFINNSADHK